MFLQLLLLFSFLLLYVVVVRTMKPANFPPGPPSLPIVGSLPFLLARSQPGQPKTFLQGILRMVERHGKVVGFYYGHEPACYIGDYKILKEVMNLNQTACRPCAMPLNRFRYGWETLNGTENEGNLPGVVYMEGEGWKKVRRFLLRHLRDFGFGKRQMEDMVLEQVDQLVNHLADESSEDGKTVTLQSTFNIAVVNALMSILLGKQFSLGDPEAMEVVQQLEILFRKTNGIRTPWSAILPSSRMILWPGMRQLSKVDKMKASMDELKALLNPLMDQHEENFDPNSINDLYDALLEEVRNTSDPDSVFFRRRGHAISRGAMIELFVAGSETTSSSLQWAFLYTLHHPDIKRRVQDEMDGACGPKDLPTFDDRETLPFTQAVLHESFRLSCLAPFSVPHRTSSEVKVGPYTVPKNTTLFPGLLHVMRDPEAFPDPTRFNPDRFMTPDGKFQASDRVAPFGIGKRSCLGQSLAEQSYFLFFAAIMKKFDLAAAEDDPLPGYDVMDNQGMMRTPPPFKCLLTKRG